MPVLGHPAVHYPASSPVLLLSKDLKELKGAELCNPEVYLMTHMPSAIRKTGR